VAIIAVAITDHHAAIAVCGRHSSKLSGSKKHRTRTGKTGVKNTGQDQQTWRG